MNGNDGRPVGDGAPHDAVKDDERDDTLRAVATSARAQAAEAYAWACESAAWIREVRAEAWDTWERAVLARYRAQVARREALSMYAAALKARMRTDEVRELAEAAGAHARALRARGNPS